jgi:hypothetical protein
MRKGLVSALMVSCYSFVAGYAHAAQECETMAVVNAQGRVQNLLTCKGEDGVWRPVRPPALPRGATALLMKEIKTDETILRERLSVIVKERNKSLEGERKTANRLYSKLPRPPYNRRMVAHLDPARAPIEAVRQEIDNWNGALAGEEQFIFMLSDSRNSIGEIIVSVVQKAVNNSEQVFRLYSRAMGASATVRASEQRKVSNDELSLQEIRAEALWGQYGAARRLQTTYHDVLTALEQGGPEQYQARYDAFRATGPAAARQREMELKAIEDRVGAILAGALAFETYAKAQFAINHKNDTPDSCKRPDVWRPELNICYFPKCPYTSDGGARLGLAILCSDEGP